MAQALSVTTELILKNVGKTPNVALQIDGIGLIFGAMPIFEIIRWDSSVNWDDSGLTWDGLVEKIESRDYISLNGTTKNITQQIYPDKQGSNSISTVNIEIIDKDGKIAKDFAYNKIGEILGRQADFFMGFAQSEFPADYIPIYRGVIVDYFWKSGTVNITISNPTTLQRQDIFTKINTVTTFAIDNTTTTIPVESTDGFLLSQDAYTSMIRIGDEIMEIVSIDSDTQLTVIRERENTIAENHDAGTEVDSFGVLKGDAVDLALKLMLSDPEEIYKTSTDIIKSFCFVSSTEVINNAIIFESSDIKEKLNLTNGDKIRVDGHGEFTVTGSGFTSLGDSYYLVLEDLPVLQLNTSNWDYKSKYNVLPDGLGMQTYQVDVDGLEGIKQTFLPSFVEMKFYLSDGMDNAKGFIDEQLFYPCGMYGVPRNARASARFSSPPLSTERLTTLDETNILNISDLRIRRSTHKYLYNRVLFEYDKDPIDDKYKAVFSVLDTDSTSRIKIGKKQLKISSEGFRRNPETRLALDNLKKRFLDRYKFAPTYVEGIKLPLSAGFGLDVGDVVFFGGDKTQLADYDTGERKLRLEKYEVINKSLSLDGVSVDLLNTGFSTTGLYALFSPSAIIQEGSSTTRLILGFDLPDDNVRHVRDYFTPFIGQKVRVRSEDYTFDETVTLTGIDEQNINAIFISELSAMPLLGYVLEFSFFDDITSNLFKLRYTFTMRSSQITSVINSQEFDVIDASLFFIGQLINIHSDDYTRDQDAVIDSIAGNTITLTEPLDFIPEIDDTIEQLEYQDQDGYFFL